METRGGIYRIRNIETGKVYIGSAVCIARRIGLHKRRLAQGKHHSAKLQNAWNKDGEAAFEFSVIEIVEDAANLLGREQFWLDETSAARDGYNMVPTAGSLLGHKMSAETKRKMSERRSGKKLSPEHVQKVRAALTGRKMTDEQRQKMRAAKLGKKRGSHSEEHRAKIAAANNGRVFSEEHKRKLSLAKTGKKQPPEMVDKRMAGKRAAFEKRNQMSPP